MSTALGQQTCPDLDQSLPSGQFKQAKELIWGDVGREAVYDYKLI